MRLPLRLDSGAADLCRRLLTLSSHRTLCVSDPALRDFTSVRECTKRSKVRGLACSTSKAPCGHNSIDRSRRGTVGFQAGRASDTNSRGDTMRLMLLLTVTAAVTLTPVLADPYVPPASEILKLEGSITDRADVGIVTALCVFRDSSDNAFLIVAHPLAEEYAGLAVYQSGSRRELWSFMTVRHTGDAATCDKFKISGYTRVDDACFRFATFNSPGSISNPAYKRLLGRNYALPANSPCLSFVPDDKSKRP
jgi:hypothetical protein